MNQTHSNSNEQYLCGQIDERIVTLLELEATDQQRHDVTTRDRVNEIGNLLERKFLIQGFEEQINQISVIITDMYEQHGIRNWHHVCDFLPSKWKDPNKQTFKSIDDDSYGRLPPEGTVDYIKVLQDFIKDVPTLPPEVNKQAFSLVTKGKDVIDKDSQLRKYPILHDRADEKYRDPVNTLKGQSMITVMEEAIDRHIKKWQELKQDVHEFPPEFAVDAERYARGINAATSLIYPFVDDKCSMDSLEWWNHETFRQHHGKHASAVDQPVMTNLCIICSEGVDEDPNAFVEMYSDINSPTFWRCRQCGGTEGRWRDMTREQIGDKTPDILQAAKDFASHIPGYIELCKWYRNWKQLRIYARKDRLAVKLSHKA